MSGKTVVGKPATSFFTADCADGVAELSAAALMGADGDVAAAEAEADEADEAAEADETGVLWLEQAVRRTMVETAPAAQRHLRDNGTMRGERGMNSVMTVSLAAGAGAMASAPVYPRRGPGILEVLCPSL